MPNLARGSYLVVMTVVMMVVESTMERKKEMTEQKVGYQKRKESQWCEMFERE